MHALGDEGAPGPGPSGEVRRMVNVLFTAALMLVGPALVVTSYQQVDADEELARTGVQVTGSITHFSDGRRHQTGTSRWSTWQPTA